MRLRKTGEGSLGAERSMVDMRQSAHSTWYNANARQFTTIRGQVDMIADSR
jgi:hypothetical protein